MLEERSGVVFMRRVSLQGHQRTVCAMVVCQLGTLHSFSVQHMCGAMQSMDLWMSLSQSNSAHSLGSP